MSDWSASRYDRMVDELCALTDEMVRRETVTAILQNYGAAVPEVEGDLVWSAGSVNGDPELTLVRAAHSILWKSADAAERRRVLAYLQARVDAELGEAVS